MIRTIPLNKLVPSPRNVRRSSDPQADLELAADIEAHGLLQNLVVTSAKPKGAFAVEAGERRRKALQSLAEQGKLPADHEVCCLVLDHGSAVEASLAENFQRLAMNPADECLAFSALLDQGSDVETIARRFGLTMRFVEGRLRLAALAPAVFDALGAGEISLDVAKAFAATPDVERQAHVFEQVANSYTSNHPDSIRRMMTQATLEAGDRRARFVGEDAYVSAGGRIERDLFADEDQARWLDIDLVDRLATERLEELASEMHREQGFAFVRATLNPWVGYPLTEGLRRVPAPVPPLDDEEVAKVEVLEERIGAEVALLEQDELDDTGRAAAEARLAELDAAVDAIVNKPPVLDDAFRAGVGVFLILDQQGQPKLDPGFYAEIVTEASDDEPAPDPADRLSAAAAGIPAKSQLSRRLVDELAMQRRDILAVRVAADPAFAKDLATFLMIDREGRYASGGCGSSLSASAPSNPAFDFRTPGAAATLAAEQAREALDRSWAEFPSHAERFDAFRALPEEARAAWLGRAVARTLEASVHEPGERACPFHDHLGRLLGIDVSVWWRPTGANYFDRVPKSLALQALAEVGGPELAGRHAKAKKSELAQACERIFAGDVIADVETKAAALAWVPPAMRFAAAVVDGAGVEDHPEPSGEESSRIGDHGLGASAQSDAEIAIGEAA